jgi:xanthine dehydrogenase molybdopterin-binding subunit B
LASTGGIQFSQLLQMSVAAVLGMSANQVIVKPRRTGGAYPSTNHILP